MNDLIAYAVGVLSGGIATSWIMLIAALRQQQQRLAQLAQQQQQREAGER